MAFAPPRAVDKGDTLATSDFPILPLRSNELLQIARLTVPKPKNWKSPHARSAGQSDQARGGHPRILSFRQVAGNPSPGKTEDCVSSCGCYARAVRAILHILAVLALLSLSAMPMGFMPVALSDGTVAIKICSGQQPSTEWYAATRDDRAHDANHPVDHEKKENKRCDYAVGSVTNLPQSPLLPPPALEPLVIERTQAHALTGLFPRGLPPSTGPPSV